MKKLIYILLVVFAIGAVAFTLLNNKKQMAANAAVADLKSDAIPVLLTEAKSEKIDKSFTAHGNFQPIQSLTLLSETQGQVLQVHKRKGDKVRAGEVLIDVENNTMRADLITAQGNYDKLKRDLARFENLAEGEAITKRQLEDVRQGVKQAEAQLIMAKQRLAKSRITAPFSGEVNEIFVEVGSYLSPGTRLYDIVNVDKLKLNVKVAEREVLLVQKGAKVTIKADADPTQEYTGTVKAIAAKSDPTMKYDVELEVSNSTASALRAGMYGTALFPVAALREALLLPREAVVGSIQEPSVYVVTDGKAQLKKITLGTVLQDKVEVLSGLAQGEQVVQSGQINLRDGMKVKAL